MSVRATMHSVLATRGRQRYVKFLSSVLEIYDLLVLGYSGADDLDIVPILADAKSDRRLFWVDHQSSSSVVVRTSAEILAASDLAWELDAVGRDRIWFTTSGTGEQIRDPDNTLMISTRTAAVVDVLKSVYGPDVSLPVQQEPFQLDVAGYFSQWSANLKAPKSATYSFLLAATEHAYRPWLPKARRRWERKRRRLQRSPSASPAEVIGSLIDEYNDLAQEVDRAGDFKPFSYRLQRLDERFQEIVERLTPELKGPAFRLAGCLAYLVDDATNGEVSFGLAVTEHQKLHDEIGELATLQTWQRHKYAAIGRGVFAAATFQAPDGNHYRLDPHAPSERRINELVDRTGYLTTWWQDMIATSFASVSDAGDRIWLLDKIQRHCVDVGDTKGEAICAQKLALELCAEQQGLAAIEQLWRLQQLILIQPTAADLLTEARVSMPFMGCSSGLNEEATGRYKQLLEKSMWAGSVTKHERRGLLRLFGGQK